MEGLFKWLPPFAPDYSGVCSVLFELGGITVIHDGGGCTGNVCGYDEPRWYGSKSALFSSTFREVEAILGNDEIMLGKLTDAVSEIGPKFIAIIGTPAPMVIGTDYAAIAKIVSKRTGIPAIVFDTTGINFYDHGQSLAFLELAKQFIPDKANKDDAPQINILGATPLDFLTSAQITDLQKLIEDAGFSRVCCWSMGAGLEEIANAAASKLNIVVSPSGLSCARYLRDRFNIPYFVSYPVGEYAYNRFQAALVSFAQSGALDVFNHFGDGASCPSNCAKGKKILVIHQQVLANAIRDCLRNEFNADQVSVATFFELDSEIKEAGDLHLVEEDDIRQLTQRQSYDIILGDPLYKGLLAGESPNYIELPHFAVSGQLFSNIVPVLIGKESTAYFARALDK
jgi:nitrogenase molybdenum-iron protein alpha/beta subunit